MTSKITAKQLIDLLSIRHSEDIFVPECKDGETQGASSYLRMDAWVMKKSYSSPLTTVYETKVSRGDFLNDRKWINYLPYCNEFYFVAPKDLIGKNELPPGVGLIEASANAKMLITRKKAFYRNVEIPTSLYLYILMSRTKIVAPKHGFDQALAIREWLIGKRDREYIGLKIRKKIAEEFAEIKAENSRMKRKTDELESIGQFVESLGIDTSKPFSRWNVERIIKGEDKSRLLRQIDSLSRTLTGLREEIDPQGSLL